MSEMPKAVTFEGKRDNFTIGAPVYGDSEAIGPMHLQSWLESYANEDAGVTEDWIKEEFAFLADESGADYRQKKYDAYASGGVKGIYRVAKDKNGEVVGFMEISEHEDGQVELDALYTLDRVQGQGLGGRLMSEAIDWAGDRSVRLEVVEYNKKAIGFYEKFGFKLTGEQRNFKGPINAVEMIREPQT